MPGENAEVIRQLYEQWSRGDFSNREPFADDLDFELAGWVLFEPEPIRARGVDGMAEVWREVLGGWEAFRTGPVDKLFEDGDTVVVLNRLVGRGRQSGIEVDAYRGAVFTFRAGKISRVYLTDAEEALATIGRSL